MLENQIKSQEILIDDHEKTVRIEPEQMAQMAGLRYVNDDEPGFRRKPWGRGFTYLHPNGEHIQEAELRSRLEALVIPPAWTDVWICLDPNGHIQATGRDAQGRKQYIYHADWGAVRNQVKFSRIVSFAESLPDLRMRVDQDLRLRNLSREKVVAIVVRLLEETLIRIGNLEYARNNGSFGLTTLHDEHLKVSGSTLYFEFNGKSGKQHEIAVQDRRLAAMVKRCQDLPGQHLFQYLDGEGNCCQAITSGDVNEYLRRVTGKDFTAKDFRTWGGTLYAAIELFRLGPAASERDAQHKIVQAVKQVAKILGNTTTICRQYYIHPAVFEAFQDESLFPTMQSALDGRLPAPDGLEPEEAAAIELLRQKTS